MFNRSRNDMNISALGAVGATSTFGVAPPVITCTVSSPTTSRGSSFIRTLSPLALLLRQCVVLLLLEQTVQVATELVVLLCTTVLLHGLLPGFAESLERHLAKRVEVVRELDSRRELRCIEPRIGEEHELARRSLPEWLELSCLPESA